MKNQLISSKYLFLLVIILLAVGTISAQNTDEGKNLFKVNCASCHAKDMKSNLTGPALGGVEERWADYPQEDLYAWIRNSQAQIASGHPRATELWNEWKPVVMTNFVNLTDDQIANILAYIDGVYTGKLGKKVASDAIIAVDTKAEESDNTLLFTVLFVILGLLALVLTRIISNLNYLAQSKEGTAPASRQTLVDTLTSKSVIGFVIFALVVLGGYTTVNNAIGLGRMQGYQPDQPIKFSHATHAGLQKIECQYCHDGARRSKHSVIPATNTCMNCHKAVKVGSQYGTAELTKIYASIGYDPTTDKYLPDYEEMEQEDIEKIYKKWIVNSFVQDDDNKAKFTAAKLSDAAVSAADKQWEDIVSSLTNDQKKKVQGPIEWVRIHNLPDHVYFNHAQHVTVGKVECQNCHGKVEEMEVVGQYSPLSMGWCINCHRQTEVQFADNDYYQSYEKYHQELKDGVRDKVTVEDVGGLECQKCHY
ncbi:MAG: c-type cytochrome [Bacteroidota bacterium]